MENIIKRKPRIILKEKKCTKCLEIKPNTLEFYRLEYNTGKPSSICKVCTNKDSGERKRKKRELELILNPPYICKNGYKLCSKCEQELPATLEYFSSHSDGMNGLRPDCKSCIAEYNKVHRDIFKKQVDIIVPETQFCNFCQQNLPLNLDYFMGACGTITGFMTKCKNCYNKQRREKYPEIKDKIYNQHQRYYQKHRDKIIAGYKESYYNDPHINISRKMAARIKEGLSKKNINKNRKSWIELVGYSSSELKAHLENLFTNGMDWEIFKTGAIHIDHILPITLFRYESFNDLEFKLCWSLENLQPLWEFDNLSKNDIVPNGKSARECTEEEREFYINQLKERVENKCPIQHI